MFGQFAVAARGPETYFILEVGESVSVLDHSGPTDLPCLRGDALELVESLSIRAPLPADAPAEWYRVLNGLATVFDSELEIL